MRKYFNLLKKDIKKFIDGGINFWMITGDKMDTAESIGYSCGIFSEDTDVYKIKDIIADSNISITGCILSL